MKYPLTALFVESPWYGVLEIVGEPDPDSTECWDGDVYSWYDTETLRPLTPAAAKILGVRWGDQVWDAKQKQAWENEPFRAPWSWPSARSHLREGV